MNKFLILFLFTTISIWSQEKTSDSTIIGENSDIIAWEVIENVPVYKGCNEKLKNALLKQCMSEKIREHVSKKFKVGIAKRLGLPKGIVKINVVFKIDAEGYIVDITASAPHPKLEEEAIRVISLIPQMEKAGYQRGKPVIIPYSLPIMFEISNSKKKK